MGRDANSVQILNKNNRNINIKYKLLKFISCINKIYNKEIYVINNCCTSQKQLTLRIMNTHTPLITMHEKCLLHSVVSLKLSTHLGIEYTLMLLLITNSVDANSNYCCCQSVSIKPLNYSVIVELLVGSWSLQRVCGLTIGSQLLHCKTH